jgi:hypothetical protein
MFGLAFGMKAVIHVEIGLTNFQVENYGPGLNDKGLKLSLDLLDLHRDLADMVMAAYHQKVAQYFNKKVRSIRFSLGDWVLRKVTLATRDPTEGKLAPT